MGNTAEIAKAFRMGTREKHIFTHDFTDDIPAGKTLSGVTTFTIDEDSDLTVSVVTLRAPFAEVTVNGAKQGKSYLLFFEGTLSDGQIITSDPVKLLGIEKEP